MRNSIARTLVWILWSIAWFVSNKYLMSIGVIVHHSWFILIIDCILSIAAAILITQKSCLGIIILILYIITIIQNFDSIGIFSLIMAAILIILTALTQTKIKRGGKNSSLCILVFIIEKCRKKL